MIGNGLLRLQPATTATEAIARADNVRVVAMRPFVWNDVSYRKGAVLDLPEADVRRLFAFGYVRVEL